MLDTSFDYYDGVMDCSRALFRRISDFDNAIEKKYPPLPEYVAKLVGTLDLEASRHVGRYSPLHEILELDFKESSAPYWEGVRDTCILVRNFIAFKNDMISKGEILAFFQEVLSRSSRKVQSIESPLIKRIGFEFASIGSEPNIIEIKEAISADKGLSHQIVPESITSPVVSPLPASLTPTTSRTTISGDESENLDNIQRNISEDSAKDSSPSPDDDIDWKKDFLTGFRSSSSQITFKAESGRDSSYDGIPEATPQKDEFAKQVATPSLTSAIDTEIKKLQSEKPGPSKETLSSVPFLTISTSRLSSKSHATPVEEDDEKFTSNLKNALRLLREEDHEKNENK